MDDESKVKEEILQFMEEYSRGELFIHKDEDDLSIIEKKNKLWSFIYRLTMDNPYNNQFIRDEKFVLHKKQFDDGTLGAYAPELNMLLINSKYIDVILLNNNKNTISEEEKAGSLLCLMMLIKTIGHEVRHYYQNQIGQLYSYEDSAQKLKLQNSQEAYDINYSLNHQCKILANEFKQLFSFIDEQNDSEYFSSFKTRLVEMIPLIFALFQV